MAALSSIAIGGAALAGGIGGAMGSEETTTKNVDMTTRMGLDMDPASRLENKARGLSQDQLSQLQSMVAAGPGQTDVAAGAQANRGLAALLGRMRETGGLPGEKDISAANQFSQDIFGARRLAMQQSFQDQLTSANRQAAVSGRGLNDPILRAKLAQEQTRQSDLLQAQQQGLSTQFAMGLPMQRLAFAQQRAGVLSGLGDQALRNRSALFGMGQSALAQERQFRINTADRVQTQRGTTTATAESGGGLGGFLSGALSGGGIGAQAAKLFESNNNNNGGGFSGGFGGGGAQPGSLNNNIFGVGGSISHLAQNPNMAQQGFAMNGPNPGLSMPTIGSSAGFGQSRTLSLFGG